MKVFLQDKVIADGHRDADDPHRPINQRRRSARRCAHKHRIGFPGCEGHWRFAGENIDIAAGKALTILIKQP